MQGSDRAAERQSDEYVAQAAHQSAVHSERCRPCWTRPYLFCGPYASTGEVALTPSFAVLRVGKAPYQMFMR